MNLKETEIEKEIEKELLKVLRKSNNSEEFKIETENFIKNYKKIVIMGVLRECLHSNQIETEGVTMTYTATEDSIKKLAKDKYNIKL